MLTIDGSTDTVKQCEQSATASSGGGLTMVYQYPGAALSWAWRAAIAAGRRDIGRVLFDIYLSLPEQESG
jgi:hypothetical protein